jgi:hypothetical protein
VLGEFGDLIGDWLELGDDRQRDFTRYAHDFFVQLRNLCCGVGTVARCDRLAAYGCDLLGAFRIFLSSRLEFFDTGAVLGRLGQFEHLVAEMAGRFHAGGDIVVRLLQFSRAVGETNIPHTDLHAGDRRLRLHRIACDRLLPGHARVEIAHRHVGPDLDNHHCDNEQYTEARGDAELGADREIEKEAGNARHG